MIRKEEQMKNIRLFLVILLLGMAATAAGQIDEDFEVTPFDFWVPSAGNNSPTPSLSNSYNNTPGYTPGTSVYMQRNTTEREASSGYLTSQYMEVIPTTVSMWVYNDSTVSGWGNTYVHVESSPDGVTWTNAGSFHNGNINAWENAVINLDPDANTHFIRIYVVSNKTGMWYIDDISITGGELPLPVELSGFMAQLSVDNFVNLTWITQSETGVLGFYILRNNSLELGSATTISELIPATNTSQQQSYIYNDREIFEEGTYYYWLQNSDLDGAVQYHGPVSILYTPAGSSTPEIPLVTKFKSVYPNPFNPKLTLPFSLAESGNVSIAIFNSRGQLVRSIELGTKTPGHHNAEWDGRDNSGATCSTGVYSVRMNIGTSSHHQKAVLLK